jgi:hypothetical protein
LCARYLKSQDTAPAQGRHARLAMAAKAVRRIRQREAQTVFSIGRA